MIARIAMPRNYHRSYCLKPDLIASGQTIVLRATNHTQETMTIGEGSNIGTLILENPVKIKKMTVQYPTSSEFC